MQSEIERLIALSGEILNRSVAEQSETPSEQTIGEDLLELAIVYVTEFENWFAGLAGKNPLAEDTGLSDSERATLRGSLETLQTNHQRVVAILNSLKSAVVEDLGELQKRGKALRTYIDRFPSRITVTGRRKG